MRKGASWGEEILGDKKSLQRQLPVLLSEVVSRWADSGGAPSWAPQSPPVSAFSVQKKRRRGADSRFGVGGRRPGPWWESVGAARGGAGGGGGRRWRRESRFLSSSSRNQETAVPGAGRAPSGVDTWHPHPAMVRSASLRPPPMILLLLLLLPLGAGECSLWVGAAGTRQGCRDGQVEVSV